MNAYHVPVMKQEVLEAFSPLEGKRLIDATLGGGGHTEALLRGGANILAIDADPTAIEHAKRTLSAYSKPQLALVNGNFRNLGRYAAEAGFTGCDGILMDLGVSSRQLDDPAKGFGYRHPDAPLDMRFGPDTERTAGDILNHGTMEELYEIISRYGEEERSGAIAGALLRARQVNGPFEKTADAEAVIRAAVPKGQPPEPVLSRVFQALRISVNDELGALREGLEQARETLKDGGILAVITFHSLEDRIVKNAMREPEWDRIQTKPILATEQEVYANPRARSAKLRIARKKHI